MIAHLHLGGDAGSLEQMEDDPSAYLVQQHGLHASVEGIDPRLMVLRGAPDGDDVVAVLEEAHPCAYGVIGAASEAVIPGGMCPRIDNPFHCDNIFCGCKGTTIFAYMQVFPLFFEFMPI